MKIVKLEILLLSMLFLLVGCTTNVEQELTKEEAIRLAIEGENQLSTIVVFGQMDRNKALDPRCDSFQSEDHYFTYICDATTEADIRNKLDPFYTPKYIEEIMGNFRIQHDKNGVLAELFDGGYSQKSKDSIRKVTIEQNANRTQAILDMYVGLDGERDVNTSKVEYEYVQNAGWRIASNGLLFSEMKQ
ncbi:DL-endopeptidase inhibitor IseA family protein [Paenibacillus jamilae]